MANEYEGMSESATAPPGGQQEVMFILAGECLAGMCSLFMLVVMFI